MAAPGSCTGSGWPRSAACCCKATRRSPSGSGLEPRPTITPHAWAVRRGALTVEGGRLNAEFFHPERVLAVRLIVEGATPAHRLDAVADFVKDKQKGIRAEDTYIGLANVERDTGELVAAEEEKRTSRPATSLASKAGDVLFGKLRPYLKKVHLADTDGVCSPEFFVLRPHDGIRGEHLAAILRSQLLTQTRHMAGGNTHTRLTPTDVHATFIPVPEEDRVQDEIADAEVDNRAEARQLKAQAGADWNAAKQQFGDDLVD